MARIVAVVLNGVTQDARVCRAAAALRDAGHEVIVVGVRDSADLAEHETLPNGAEIHRLEQPVKRRRTPKINTDPLVPLDDPDTVPIRSAPGVGFPLPSRRLFLLLKSGLPRKMLREDQRLRVREATFARAIEALRPDIVHAHDIDTLPMGAQAAKATGAALVFDAHEIYDQLIVRNALMEARRRRSSYLLASLSKSIDGFITLTEGTAEYYTSIYKQLPEPTIVGNAAPCIPPVHYDGRLHAAAGLPAETRILLYQGRYSQLRCLAELIASAEYLPPDWGIVTLGYAAEKHRMESNRNALPPEAQERIKILDAVPQTELPTWTAGATLGYLALPKTHLSYTLASPNRLWAYPQVGVPVLGTDFVELERVKSAYGIAFTLAGKVSGQSVAASVAAIDEPAFDRARAGCRGFMEAEGWQVHAQRLVAMMERIAAPGYRPRHAR